MDIRPQKANLCHSTPQKRSMKYFLAPILLFVCAHLGLQAQNLNQTNTKISLYETAIILPNFDNKALLKEELTNQEPGRPIKFAEAYTTKIDVDNSGIWDASRQNTATWKLRIESKGALSLNLGFTQFYLPEGAELYIHNEDRSYSIGPFTNSDNDDHRQLWTPIIKDDVLIIELFIPENKKEELVLELTKINHDYLGFGRSFSGSCNLDVVCGQADGFDMVDAYRDIIQSVGAYHVNGVETCSGALINNAREDKTPYFLTANHCGVNAGNAGSVVAYWNYQNSFCRQPDGQLSGQPGDGNLNQFNTGAINRANWAGSDVSLIEFDDPIRAEYDPYFSGWQNNFESTPIVIGIHHPGVEEKRISFDLDQVNNAQGNYIRIADWDVGTTEGGSSGSPIFNDKKQIIGQLQGGLAACSNDLWDEYGSINASWFGGGSSANSLQPWLDPDNTGITELDGFNGRFGLALEEDSFTLCPQNMNEFTINFEVGGDFQDFVNIQFQNLPLGTQIVSLDENLLPGETSQIVIYFFDNLSSGIYEIILVSSDGENIVENKVTISVSKNIPNKVVTVSPLDQSEGIQVVQEFIWENVEHAVSYTLEISETEDFSNIVTSVNNITGTNITIDDLENLGTYFWRVSAINHCGVGEWSEVFSFSTSNTYCITVSALDLPITISENGQSQNTSSLFVDYPIVVDKISIPNLRINHSYLGDLVILLNNPENDNEVQILSEECGPAENINAGFSDTGLEQIICPPVEGTLFQPITPFRDLVGINAQGRWDLDVFDTYSFDGGTILSWNIELCFSATEEATIIPLDGELSTVCLEQNNSLRFYYDLEGSIVDEIILETASGENVPFEYDGDLPLSGTGELDITLLGTDLLDEGFNELYISLGSNLESNINVVLSAVPETPVITSFAFGEILPSLDNLQWTGSNTNLYTVYIAEDAEFTNILWSETVVGNINELEVPSLENGEYFVVIEAMNNCGTISSELYNFILDETVSISESKLPTLIVGQNLANNSIFLSGNSTRDELQINIISVSGHKLLSQSFHEESLRVDVNAMIPGVYFLQITSGIDSTIRKIVIY